MQSDSLEKTLMLGKEWRLEEKGMTEDKMVGWHHQLDEHELEQAPEVVDGLGSLAWGNHGVAKSQTDWATELNRTELKEKTKSAQIIAK